MPMRALEKRQRAAEPICENGAMKQDTARCSLFADKVERAVDLIEEFATQATAWRTSRKRIG
jgi:hypothetical protein